MRFRKAARTDGCCSPLISAAYFACGYARVRDGVFLHCREKEFKRLAALGTCKPYAAF
jgi:hypothetical protein